MALLSVTAQHPDATVRPGATVSGTGGVGTEFRAAEPHRAGPATRLAFCQAGADHSAVPPETRYARSGDVSIAYQTVGDGPFDLVLAPGFVSNVEYAWRSLRSSPSTSSSHRSALRARLRQARDGDVRPGGRGVDAGDAGWTTPGGHGRRRKRSGLPCSVPIRGRDARSAHCSRPRTRSANGRTCPVRPLTSRFVRYGRTFHGSSDVGRRRSGEIDEMYWGAAWRV